MNKRSLEFLTYTAQEIALTSAAEAGAIGYISRMMAIASLFPYRDPRTNEFVRKNGQFTLTILSPSSIGIPFGSFPRLLLVEIVTKAKISKTPEVFLARSPAELLKKMQKFDTGGATGTRQTLTKQCQRLFASSISVSNERKDCWTIENRHFAKSASIFWQPKTPTRWAAEITLDQTFFEEIQNSAIPIDLRVVNALSYYSQSLDAYFWLTYRFFFLKKPTVVTWQQLAKQFGNNMSTISNFRRELLKSIRKVQILYPGANVKPIESGLLLFPSKPYIPSALKSPFDTT